MNNNDFITGKTKNYKTNQFINIDNEFEIQNAVCIFSARFLNNNQIIRKYFLIDYFESLNHEMIKDLNFNGGSPEGFFTIITDKKNGNKIAEDIKAVKENIFI